jgi:hypothetical protein
MSSTRPAIGYLYKLPLPRTGLSSYTFLLSLFQKNVGRWHVVLCYKTNLRETDVFFFSSLFPNYVAAPIYVCLNQKLESHNLVCSERREKHTSSLSRPLGTFINTLFLPLVCIYIPLSSPYIKQEFNAMYSRLNHRRIYPF